MTWIDDEEKAEIADERDVAQERLAACRNLIRDQADSLRDEVTLRVEMQTQLGEVLEIHRRIVTGNPPMPVCTESCPGPYPCETAIAAGAKS